jgi:hypothetical protein
VDPTHLRGYSLNVTVDGAKAKLLLDTGASGITIDRVVAGKADIVKLSNIDVGGIGDKARAGGFVGIAKSIQIGELEYQDCRVDVIEKRSVLGDDGLIGGDIFNHYLVDIDFPKEKLRLTPLPARPDEKLASLENPGGKENSMPNGDSPSGEGGSNPDANPVHRGPRDRYIAPEMQSYTRIYRFGHDLLVPTVMADQQMRLFAIDTGSSVNLLSLRAAYDNTKVHNNPQMRVDGLSGSVAKVYLADKALLQFGHLKQENQAVTAFDLSALSDKVGTEISGILGFTTLDLLEIRIDYRDGLVDFSYQPHR